MDTVTTPAEPYRMSLEEQSNESLWAKIQVLITELARIKEELMQLRYEFQKLNSENV